MPSKVWKRQIFVHFWTEGFYLSKYGKWICCYGLWLCRLISSAHTSSSHHLRFRFRFRRRQRSTAASVVCLLLAGAWSSWSPSVPCSSPRRLPPSPLNPTEYSQPSQRHSCHAATPARAHRCQHLLPPRVPPSSLSLCSVAAAGCSASLPSASASQSRSGGPRRGERESDQPCQVLPAIWRITVYKEQVFIISILLSR